MKLVYYDDFGSIRGIEHGDHITPTTVVHTMVIDYPDDKQLEGMDMTKNPPMPILIDKPTYETEIEKLKAEIEALKSYRQDIDDLQSSQDDQDEVLDYLLAEE